MRYLKNRPAADAAKSQEPDRVVAHGAGWATFRVNGKTLNIVTLHTWPQAYAFRAEDKESSKTENGGDKCRAMEVRYICEHTIGAVPGAEKQLWMMLGDFNSRSRSDNGQYGFPEDDPRFLTQDYIHENMPYVDVIKARRPQEFKPSVGSKGSRIDYASCTRPLYERIRKADILWDPYTRQRCAALPRGTSVSARRTSCGTATPPRSAIRRSSDQVQKYVFGSRLQGIKSKIM